MSAVLQHLDLGGLYVQEQTSILGQNHRLPSDLVRR